MLSAHLFNGSVGCLDKAPEIASTVGFIIENDYVNGRVVEIDGGIRL
ncbi:short-chain dehydrogenase [Shewanella glacialimarina]|nr:short-chain dehydrogenase [Shewanella glacialimarina]